MTLPSRTAMLLLSMLACATLLVPIMLREYPALFSAIGVGGISVLMLFLFHSRSAVILYGVVALCGPIAEAVAVSYGLWTYSDPTALGIPLWLPFVWGNAGLFIVGVYRWVERRVG